MSIVPVPNPEKPQSRSGVYSFVCITCAVGLIAALVFSAFPDIDLAVSRLFYLGDGHFLFAKPGIGATLRDLLRLAFVLVCIAAVLGFCMMAFFNWRFFGLDLAAWIYIALCAGIGPGLVANLGFKDHWGRARPVHISEFGGAKRFTPPLLRTDQCERNCSFIAGEASNIFVLGFAFAFLARAGRRRTPAQDVSEPTRSKIANATNFIRKKAEAIGGKALLDLPRPNLYIAAILAGSFAGLIRIGGGGHFLSDVVFAGVFMAFVARGLAWLIFERGTAYLAEGGPFHQHMIWAGRQIAFNTRRAWRTGKQRLQKRAPPGSGPKASA